MCVGVWNMCTYSNWLKVGTIGVGYENCPEEEHQPKDGNG